MGIKKIAQRLREALDSTSAKKKIQIETIERLLGKLEKKREKILKKLENVDSKKERKELTLKLEMCNAQYKKGKKALFDLQ